MATTDSKGVELKEGDTVITTKTLRVKGYSRNLHRGEKIENIRLIDSEEAVEATLDSAKVVLLTKFLIKAQA